MLPYKSLIQLKRGTNPALHIQICNSFIALIANGSLAPSSGLPSSRILAALIGVNRNTVKLAYEELIGQGWASSVERKGIYVLPNLPILKKDTLKHPVIDNGTQASFVWNNRFEKTPTSPNFQKSILTIDDGFPDVRLTPVDNLMREYRSISKKFYGKHFLKYGDSKGSERLRIALSTYLSNTRAWWRVKTIY